MKTTLDIQYTVVDTPNLFTNPTNISGLDNLLRFNLPSTLEAGSPPEARGLARDEVRLMISYQSNNHIEHTQFRQLSSFLEAGDVVVINTSQTINGALRATRADGDQLELHLSTRLPADLWLVELRQPVNNKTIPFADGIPGEQLNLPDGGLVQLQTPYLSQQRADPVNNSVRLWVATLQTPEPLYDYLNHH
ncbi:MAG: S-adenosylmethionine:tRNA ribosyltransferase-isomerase, partial [Chloroflexota bacterium]